MANPQGNFEVPHEMRDFAEKSVDQARKAFDGFLGAARRTADTLQGSANTVQSSAKDAASRGFEFAEQNVAAAFELAQKIVRSKDPQEAMQHQAEFVRSQFAAMQAQMKEFGAMAQGAMHQTAEAAKAAAQQATQNAQNATNAATQAAKDTMS
jgi:phasin